MTWASAVKKIRYEAEANFVRPITPATVDWARLVTLDFETFYSTDYTLKKMSTSEYVRDPRFKAQQVGIKIGDKPTKVYGPKQMKAALAKINWSTHSLLCHNTQFDGFILHHHFGIHPAFYYDTLSMARGLHSNEIGASLNDVAEFYGKGSKIEGALEQTKGVLDWPKALFDQTAVYCAQDVDLTYAIFKEMHAKYPADEFRLIDLTMRMFCDPVLKVDIPRVEKELVRELDERKRKFYAAVNPRDWDGHVKELLKTKAERELQGEERDTLMIKRVIGSDNKFADLLRAEGVEPPVKVSPAWMKKDKAGREDETDKWTYAFAKDDLNFINIPADVEQWRGDLEPNVVADIPKIVAKQARLEDLIACRLAVKSTTNITRAERFLTAGANGMPLPVGYAYYRAHTGRFGGNNKMNMQNLKRPEYGKDKLPIPGTGELRQSILAPKGYQLAVQDSGQIEARVNGWLWDQNDLIKAFRESDTGVGSDAYCNFATLVYSRSITNADKTERFLGKVCIAEGELVLTARGLVPINLISTQDRLWDGVEWVTHDGLIDQGIKEVITYEGLTATPDHEVFTEDGRIIPLRQAASEMARLQTTGFERQAIRFCDDHVIADTPRKRLSVCIGEMHAIGGDETNQPQQLGKRKNYFVPGERTQTGGACGDSWQTIRRDPGQMQQPDSQALEKLRWPGNQMLVRDQDGIHPMGCIESAAQRLQGGGDRPDEQRRELRAREFETGYQSAAEPKQTQYGKNHVARTTSAAVKLPESVQPSADFSVYERGAYRGTDSGVCSINGDSKVQKLARDSRQVRCYDIANAGPRFRYTVSDKLVLNCVLGLGYSMGAEKFQITLAKGALGGPPIHLSLNECMRIVNMYRRANYKIVQGWSKCTSIIQDMFAGKVGSHKCIGWEHEKIWLPNGMCLKYPELRVSTNKRGWEEWSYKSGDMRKKLYGGLLCLGADTQVLTNNGWKSILYVGDNDKLWDGAEWVSHSGLVYQGTKETIDFGGVRMTPDHEVRVGDYWIEAQEANHYEATSSFEEYHRTPVWTVDSNRANRERRAQDLLVDDMQVWELQDDGGVRLPEGEHEKLWVCNQGASVGSKIDPWNVKPPCVFSMEKHDGSLSAAYASILDALRRTRDYCLRGMDGFSDFLVRYADWLQAGVRPRPTRQFQGVLQGQLPLGDAPGKRTQHKSTSIARNADWPDTVMACVRAERHREHNTVLQTQQRVASGENVRQTGLQKQDVYDLLNAGPRHRFTVRGNDGKPFLVHNCENLVQALARIVVMDQMMEINKKFRVVMTTHDEVVAMPKIAQAETCLKHMYKCMTTAPAWCSDLPLNAEGGTAQNYSK